MQSLSASLRSPQVSLGTNPQMAENALARIQIFGTYSTMMDENGEIRDEVLPDELEEFENEEAETF